MRTYKTNSIIIWNINTTYLDVSHFININIEISTFTSTPMSFEVKCLSTDFTFTFQLCHVVLTLSGTLKY